MDLDQEAAEATRLLTGKIVRLVQRSRANEVMIEFTDGTRFYADAPSQPVELSVTEGNQTRR
jgi:hypothetical protein